MRAIKASFTGITTALFHKLYGTFIRPHLEYSFQAWRPWLKKDIKLLEDVQRRPTKLMKFIKGTEYEGRAELLNLDSLSCRMNKGNMILVYEIFHGFLEDFFQMAYISRLREHSLKLRKDRSRFHLRKFTFSQRVVNMWNGLPADVVASSTVRAFKAS